MRQETSIEQRNLALIELHKKLEMRIQQKGNKSFASIHEILGVLVEEYRELENGIILNDHYNIKQELLDIAVTCIFGVVCIGNKMIDW